MKVSKKYLSIFCSLMLAAAMTSCGGSDSTNENNENTEATEQTSETSELTSKQKRQIKSLEVELEKINKQLPMNMGNGLKMQKMELKDGYVITTASYPQNSDMQVDDSPENKRAILDAANQASLKRFKDLGLGLKYIYVEDGTGKTSEIVITNEEM
ncbi:MAG: hypothetical protein HFJ95_01075 [Muribaculaceae bacterium]|nr:hypothetical protein [Muribaculaceae bacterium]